MMRLFLVHVLTVVLVQFSFLLNPHTAWSQDRPDTAGPTVEFAFDPVALMTLPIGSLVSIRGSVPCSPTFASTPSVNLGLGAHGSYILDRTSPFGGGFRLRAITLSASYDDISSLFESSPSGSFDAFDAVNGRFVTAETIHSAAFTLQYLRTAVELELAFGGNILLRTGPSVGIPLSGTSREREVILSPSNATFLDRTQEREIAEANGDLTDLGVRIGMGATLVYRLPLGRSLYFEPNLGIDLGLTSVQPSWSPLVVRGGISIGYSVIPSPPKPKPDTVIVVVETPPDIPFTAQTRIDVVAEKLPIDFKRQIVARYVPVLPVVFFELNTSTITSRYTSTAWTGDEQRLPVDAEKAHQQTLNIFGSRLKASPKTRVTITGTTSLDEESRPELAQKRAEEVARFLQEQWGIDNKRLVIKSRIDPLLRSNSEYPEGREENRRVELEFSDDVIYYPIQLRSIEPITDPQQIPFTISARSPLSIQRWNVEIGSGTEILKRIEGTGQPSGTIEWELTAEDRERVLTAGRVGYKITVFDSIGRSVTSPEKPLPVRLDTTVNVATSAQRPDNKAEFLLVTFDFNSSELTRRGKQELKTILERIGPASAVEIIGYTDPLGETDRNRALAEERAQRVASQLPNGANVVSRGAAPEEAPYSATSPEGRFLSRTVRVVIANPK